MPQSTPQSMLGEFVRLLQRSIGLDAAAVGVSTIDHAVRARRAACGLADEPAYWRRLQTSPAERQALIEAVVVPETWFFRHSQAFVAMVGAAGKARRADRPLRLLSLPCSTGEEPYSMAMALIDAGFSPDDFVVDAVDVSAAALAQAERATYGRNSFRGKELGYRERHFTATGEGYRLADGVRRCVQLRRGNACDARLFPSSTAYDLIFCRNMLIYFDEAARRRAVAQLSRLLPPAGVLFVGPSEAGLVTAEGLFVAEVAQACAFRKADPQQSPPASASRPPAARIPLSDQVRGGLSARLPGGGRGAGASPAAPQAEPPPAIDDIGHLADAGRLAEAARRCEDHLRHAGPSAPVLHLLGLVREASGDRDAAADCYRKVLYLDPRHREALVHLALLLETRNDPSGARLLAERARRRGEAEKTGRA